MLDVNLNPRPVRREQGDRHAALLPYQPRARALGSQPGIDNSLLGLTELRIGVAHPEQQAMRWLACFHLPSALSGQRDAHLKLAPLRKIAVHLPEPVDESSGIGECLPEVFDPGIKAIFHPHDALAID
jgi:hypothetical protein